MAARKNYRNYNGSIKAIWGLAKSPELRLDEETLYMIVFRETKKEHISKLTQGEINKVCLVLSNMKDDVKRANAGKRTDTNGKTDTVEQRRKIYALTERLGWNDNNNRINGFVKRMFKIDRIEWLGDEQCSKLIEVLKKMVVRQEQEAVENGSTEVQETNQ